MTARLELAKALLQDLVERGVKPGRRRLFVIDGSRALRKAIDKVHGVDQPVQRCRSHKLRNVLGHLPKGEMFTTSRLGLPAALRRGLGSTNLIDSSHSGIRQRTRCVTNWKKGDMARRWGAGAFIKTEKSYRKILGYRHLWLLKAHLDDQEPVAGRRRAR